METTTKMHNRPLDCVNPCGFCTIYEGNMPVATCLDTPAARGLALSLHPNATHGTAYYPGWKPENRELKPWNIKISKESAHYRKI